MGANTFFVIMIFLGPKNSLARRSVALSRKTAHRFACIIGRLVVKTIRFPSTRQDMPCGAVCQPYALKEAIIVKPNLTGLIIPKNAANSFKT
jgi:hypothetical protein